MITTIDAKPKAISVRAYWELKGGQFLTMDRLLSEPKMQKELTKADKAAFNRAVRKLIRAGVFQTL